MESFLQKYNWVLHLVLIALGAVMLALAFNNYLAIQLAPYTVPELPKLSASDDEKREPTRRRTPARNYARTITERCLFGCPDDRPENECPEEGCPEGQTCQEGKCVAAPDQEVSSELPVPSELNVELLGAMVADAPEYSLAMIADASSKQTYILGVGEFIMGAAEIVEIRRDRIILRRSGQLEFIKIQDSLSGNPSARALSSALPPGATEGKKNPPGPASKGGGGSDSKGEEGEKAQGVRKTGPTSYELDRATVEQELSSPEDIARQAQIVPNYNSKGKKHGIKLIGIGPSSVYKKIGINSGDVITKINGKKVTSQNQALELLDGLRKKNQASVEVERGGKRKTYNYKVK